MALLSRGEEGLKLRILRIITRLNVGGPALQVATLIRDLRGQVCEHLVVSGVCEDDEELFQFDPELREFVKELEVFSKNSSLLDDFRTLIKIRKLIKTFRPNILHTHLSKAGVLGRFAALTVHPRPKIVHTFHGHLLFGYFSTRKVNLIVFIEKLLSKFTDRLVAVGEKVKDDLLRYGIGSETKFTVIPPGFEIRESDLQITRNQLGLSNDSFVCIWLGRLTQIKSPERILEVAQILRTEKVNIEILVLGGGEELERLRNESAVRHLPIRFLGWKHNPEDYLKICDALLLTSKNEGMPTSIIQAQLLGKPVLATDVGSVSETIIQGETGTVSQYNSQLFAEVLAFWSVNKSEYERLSRNARAFSKANFSSAHLLNNHLELYRELLSD